MIRKIENPDFLPPYWTEIGYQEVGPGVFKRKVPNGPAPIVICAEKFHENRRTNLRRLAEQVVKRG